MVNALIWIVVYQGHADIKETIKEEDADSYYYWQDVGQLIGCMKCRIFIISLVMEVLI